MTESEAVEAPSVTSPRRTPWLAVALELTGSLLAAAGVVLIPLNDFFAHMTFFGAPVVIGEGSVHTYWVLVGMLVFGVVASFAGVLWREGTRAFFWHLGVAVLGLVVSLAFSVTQTGPVEQHHDQVKQTPRNLNYTPCYSGGDSYDCPGH